MSKPYLSGPLIAVGAEAASPSASPSSSVGAFSQARRLSPSAWRRWIIDSASLTISLYKPSGVSEYRSFLMLSQSSERRESAAAIHC